MIPSKFPLVEESGQHLESRAKGPYRVHPAFASRAAPEI